MKNPPLLKIGHCYEITKRGVNKDYKTIYYVSTMTDHFEHDPVSSMYSYGITCENTHESHRNYEMDCGGYIWESSYRTDLSYKFTKDEIRELSYEETLEFIKTKIRNRWIREKFGLGRWWPNN